MATSRYASTAIVLRWLVGSASGLSKVYFGLMQRPDLISANEAPAVDLKRVYKGATYVPGCLVVEDVGAALKAQ